MEYVQNGADGNAVPLKLIVPVTATPPVPMLTEPANAVEPAVIDDDVPNPEATVGSASTLKTEPIVASARESLHKPLLAESKKPLAAIERKPDVPDEIPLVPVKEVEPVILAAVILPEVLIVLVHPGIVPLEPNKYPLAPITRLVSVLVVLAYKMSPIPNEFGNTTPPLMLVAVPDFPITLTVIAEPPLRADSVALTNFAAVNNPLDSPSTLVDVSTVAQVELSFEVSRIVVTEPGCVAKEIIQVS